MVLTLAGILSTPGLAQTKRAPGTYAKIETNHGVIVMELFEKTAPITVANFTELAEAKKEWTHPKTGEKKKSRYFDGLIFHRVIPNFMIQGGDPLGEGYGGPGYKFVNEFSPTVTFDKPGRLAMANSGKNTNGSQFFITDVVVPLKAEDYTIFGQVVEGLDVVKKIALVKRNPSDKPLEPVVMTKVTIERVAAEAAK
ncbi:MAG: peptidylprolyl isomerase [Acidobacteria bacterium]|nr:peptidylprolyl isomerase [Acidobacteriota bacterium]